MPAAECRSSSATEEAKTTSVSSLMCNVDLGIRTMWGRLEKVGFSLERTFGVSVTRKFGPVLRVDSGIWVAIGG
jgi:hypothetical protein